MNIYRFEVTITDFKPETNKAARIKDANDQEVSEIKPETKSVDVIIVAKDDDSAFTQAETEVEKHYLKLPTIKEMVLLEKKKVGKAGGYVLDETVY